MNSEARGGAPSDIELPRAVWDRHAYRILAASAAALVTVGTVAYWFLEDWSWVDSLYFSTVAVTTVGFGDLAPSTDGSKLFTVLYLLIGIAIITTFLNARMRRAGERRRSRSSD